MNRTLPAVLATLAFLAGSAAHAQDARPMKLDVNTQDDDLRAGGEVTFVFRMFDGREQQIPLTHGEKLADRSTRTFTVAPRSPYYWMDVRDIGLNVKLHPGDGGLQRPDEWKVEILLHGPGASCAGVSPSYSCFDSRRGTWHFQRNGTQYTALNAVVAQCQTQADCNDNHFCGVTGKLVARCASGAPGANRMGCVRLPSPQPACGSGQSCSEVEHACVASACAYPDKDGDGHRDFNCGGDDCDDNDPNRYPGNTEVCDARGHDEDCDAKTIGEKDSDHDGYIDNACWTDGRQRFP